VLSPDSLEIRPAQRDEGDALTALCRRSKAHWGYPPAWLEAWADDLRVTPAEATSGDFFVADTAQQARVGFFGLKRPARRWHLEHLWVEPALLGRGLGRALLQAALKEARRRGARRLYVTSDPHAEAFYLKHGAQRVGERRYVLAGTPRVLPRLVFSLAD